MAYSKYMGARIKRKEDPRLITGSGVFTGDIKLPGMQYVAFVRSPYAHARINSIDVSKALECSGVLAAITGKEIAERCAPMPFPFDSGASDEEANRLRTHHALTTERVRHSGEAVAALVAADPYIAEDAIESIVVDWEALKTVADIESAVASDAPVLFDDMETNRQELWRHRSGDVEGAFANAHKVVNQRMCSQRLAGVPMEGRCVVACPDFTTGGLKIWTSTQAPHLMRNQLSEMLHISENSIRVIAPEVGGGFGVKIGVYPEDLVVAFLAHKYQMPMRWVESRIENMVATTHGRGQIADYSIAADRHGHVIGLRMRILADMGAYPLLPVVPELTGWMAVGVYKIPAVEIEIDGVFTNTTPIAAYRGAGRPEAAYYIERMMDLMAHEIGLDPVEVRRRNFIKPDEFPYRTATKKTTYDSGEYERALERALEISKYTELKSQQRKLRSKNQDGLLGVGLACYVEICGFGPYESAELRIEPSGTVTVFTGISPHGQGQETTFSQIVADRLGAKYEDIIVRHGDTASTPMGVGTMGSRGLAVGGASLVGAIEKVQKKAKLIAGYILEASPDDIELAEGHYQVRGAPSSFLTLSEIADRAYSDNLPHTIQSGLEASDFFRPEVVYPFGVHIALVEVDRDTGAICLHEYYAVDDCGPRISPILVEGQIHGGLAQGIGQALVEEVNYYADGQIATGSLMDYAVPRASQLPNFVTESTITPTPHNSLGVKGIGEAATIGSTPAVVSAVMDALSPLGIVHIDVPLRPEKIWRAMQEK